MTVFKPSGTAAQDLAVGRLVYERCRAAGLGRTIDGFLAPKAR
jgi:ornithine cyclodeaminase/alanine dehydrogenase-like protein (mu-crystallin family)